MLDLNGKSFRSIQNTSNGEVNGSTQFQYFQENNYVWANYSGGSIIKGHLIAMMDANGILSMKYHHINQNNVIMTGECISKPEIMGNGKIRFYEKWKWTNGDNSTGESIIEEI